MSTKTYCKCDYPRGASKDPKTGYIVCSRCHLVIACEYCPLLDDYERPATHEHLGYVTCDKHFCHAIDAAY